MNLSIKKSIQAQYKMAASCSRRFEVQLDVQTAKIAWCVYIYLHIHSHKFLM